MKALFLSGYFITAVSFGYSQDIIPASPEVEKLFKFMHHPTDLFTGLPKINIDLFDIKVQDIRVPITLSYNYSGYKPGEYDGKVGLGWVLDQGGVVSRTIYGLPDDLATYGQLNTFNPIFDIATLHSRTKFQEFEYLKEVLEREKDIEYDIFNYSIGGEANSFILKKNGTQVEVIKLNEDNSIKVTPIFQSQTQHIRGFEIVDRNGNRYLYGIGKADENIAELENGSMGQQKTAWFLTRIVDKNSIDTVYFDYGPLQQVIASDFYTNRNRVMYHVEMFHACIPVSGAQGEAYVDLTRNNHYTRFLNKISFRGGSVDFSYDGRYLAKMLVKNYMNDTVRNITFHYSALTSGHYYRKLDSISQPSGERHVFGYHLPGSSFQAVHPGNMGRDWLGYYNGLSTFQHPTIGSNGTLLGDARRVSHEHTKFFALNRIYYPTQGYCELEWENNRGRINSQIVAVPGLRVKAMKYVPLTGKNMTEEYKYGLNEDGTGEIVVPYASEVVLNLNSSVYLTGKSMLFMGGAGPNCPPYYYKEILSGSVYLPTNRNLSGNIYYRYVNKYMKDEADMPLGKESYEYIVPTYYQDMARNQYLARYWFDTPIRPKSNYDFPFGESIVTGNSVVGQLRSKITYEGNSGGYTVVRREVFSYAPSTVRDISYLKTVRLATYGGCTTPEWVGGSDDNHLDTERRIAQEISLGYSEAVVLGWNYDCQQSLLAPFYAYKQYAIRSVRSRLLRKEIVEYHHGDSVIREENYTYYPQTPLPSSIEEMFEPSANLMSVKSARYEYPTVNFSRFLDPGYPAVKAALINMNFHQSIISSQSLVSNYLQEAAMNGTNSSNIVEYGFFNSGLIFRKYTYTINDKSDLIVPTSWSAVRDLTEFLRYDNHGNPLEVKEDDRTVTTFLWGYKGLYPIAKIENATYPEVVAVLGQSVINSLSSAMLTDDMVRDAISTLRNHPSMVSAVVSTYTYKPLVGMTSMTDSRGVTTYYRYDNLGRLSAVLDFEGNILSTFCYNYAGQQVDCIGIEISNPVDPEEPEPAGVLRIYDEQERLIAVVQQGSDNPDDYCFTSFEPIFFDNPGSGFIAHNFLFYGIAFLSIDYYSGYRGMEIYGTPGSYIASGGTLDPSKEYKFCYRYWLFDGNDGWQWKIGHFTGLTQFKEYLNEMTIDDVMVYPSDSSGEMYIYNEDGTINEVIIFN
ncbi:YD repeat-containing protein [Parapedobacter composti]|uniref:YD repeat-containing protein n=1 Tax=Parapedobacter composti TaxID=623281 RepID=A0A1I1MB37_9SPHI|nr:RHS repeat domain-containing protein [Parapedobacter composti]SFC82657.1 YD repeat-containing protein [Parapedobacter composti]